LNNLSGSSYNELIEVQKKLQKEVKKGSDTVEEQNNKLSQLQRVNGQVATSQREMNSQIGSSNNIFSQAAAGFNKYFGIIATGVASGIAVFGGIIAKMDEFAEKRKELETAQASLKSITGLGDKDINWLTKYAKELSTTTTEAGIRITASSKEILEGFTVIGSKRPELLKNKEAMAEVSKNALTLAATGMPVSEAYESVTASMNQFNLGANQTNRIINTLGAGSLEGSAEVNDLSASMKNVGTVAASSNLTLEQTVAALEVLASKQLLGEEAGTKLRGALLKMKEAGVGYVNGSFSMRDAITEINAKLKDKSNALQRDAYLQKVFGTENQTAGIILLQNVDQYDKLTVAVTGTNVAMTQAQIKTATIAAQEEQATNRINEAGMALAKNMTGISLFIKNAYASAIEALSEIAGNTKSTTDQFEDQSKKVVDLKMNIDPLISRYEELNKKTNRNTSEQVELKSIIEKVGNAIPGAVTQFDKYGNALQINGSKAKQFVEDQASLMKYLHREAIKKEEENQQKLRELVLANIEGETTLKRTGRRAIGASRGGEPIYASDAQNTEFLKQVAKAQADLKSSKMTVADLNGKTLEKQISDAKKAQQAQAEQDKKAAAEAKKRAEEDAKGGSGAEDTKAIIQARLKAKLDGLENEFIESKNKRKKLHETDKATEESYNKDLLQLKIDYLEKKKKLYKVGSKEFNEIEGQLQDIRLKQTIDGNAALLKVAQDNFKANTKSTNSFEKLEKTKLLKSLEDKTSTKKQYEDSLQALEVTANERRVADATAYADEINTVTFESEDAKVAAVETANAAVVAAEEKLALSKKAIDDKKLQEEKDFQEKRKSFREKFGLDDISSIKQQYDKELAELKKGLNDQYLTEKEFRTKKLQLGAKTGAKYAQQAVEYSGMVADAVSAYQQMETASLEAEKQKQLSAAGNTAEARAKIEADFAQKELDLKKKQSKASMAIQIAQAVAAGALAIANIWATHAANPILAGILTALSAATSLIQIGTLVKQNAAIQATTLDSSSGSADSTTTTISRVVTPQAAEGRWDVVGADDGRTYMNVPYRGVARTGIVTRPTLMGERGDELIVDNPTLRNIRMNEPWLINRIKHYRVQQRAGGNYSAVDNNASGSGSSPAYDNTAMLNALDRMIAFLQYLIDNGVKAPIVLSELEAKIALRDKSLKKGSI